MALIIHEYTLPSGIVVSRPYIRIETVIGGRNYLDLVVCMYVDSQTDYKPIMTFPNNFRFTPDITDDAPNFIKQGYKELKQHILFADAEDVLEENQSILDG